MNKDEIKMIEENECEMIKRLQSALPDAETMRFNFDKIDLATYLYDTGCRIIGEDEIVIKRETGSMVELLHREMDKQLTRKRLEKAKKEAEREVLQELKQKLCEIHSFGDESVMIEQLAKEKGIELED